MQQRDLDLDEARRQVEILSREKDLLRRKVAQLEEEHAKALLSPALTPTRTNMSECADQGDRPKMAERKRIKKISAVENIPSKENPTSSTPIDFSKVTGSDFSKVGVS